MLFTTTTFVLLFLPLVLAGFFLLGRWSSQAAVAWLFAASVFFYGWWMPAFTALLLASIGLNFWLGQTIAAKAEAGRRWLVLGIALNLGLLGYFKYANFFVDSLNAALGTDWHPGRVLLPIGISFYTFTQIAYLVDTAQGKVREARPLHYALFVTYFPHLVAGPVLHHAQMMPQFASPTVTRCQPAHIAGGLAIFALGLFKKVVLADGMAPYADAVFNPVDHLSAVPGLEEAWLGALAYSLQLYFDFSGYSDMAIGLSWMFNIRLPFNFNSPYRATSISEFWRRWHISLSTFLRDYLYVPLGGNRKGEARRYLNVMVTMVLGGLWHGASWLFVAWGALHGAYLMANHGWKALTDRAGWAQHLGRNLAWRGAAWALTMLAVVVAWLFFRAQTFDGALRMLGAMSLAGAPSSDPGALLWNAGLSSAVGWLWCGFAGAVALGLPNSNRVGQTLMARSLASTTQRALALGAALALVLFLVVINQARSAVSAFIYFNF